MQTLELLKTLTTAVGVSGAEEPINATLCKLLEPYGEVNVDLMNNVTCTFGEGYHFLLDAHLDEIGMIVKSITDDGFIKFDKCGGIDARMLPDYEVSVWGKREVTGVISTLPPHLQNDEDEKHKAPDIDALSIDIGMTKEQAQELIAPGDRITFKRNFTPLLGTQVSSSVLDDRCGVAAILLAAEQLKNINAKITVLFSAQEEVGCRGAQVAPYHKHCDEAIAVDVSFGWSPLCKKTDCGEIGKGPMIGFSAVLDNTISRKLVEVAEKNGIPYQREAMGGGHTGTNADDISVSESGIRTALLSIPEKYMHSPIEVVDAKDVENTAALIAAYIKERAGEINA